MEHMESAMEKLTKGDLLAVLSRPTMLASDLEQGKVAPEDVAKVEEEQSEASAIVRTLIDAISDPQHILSLEVFGPRPPKLPYQVCRDRIFLYLRYIDGLSWESMEDYLVSLGHNVNQKKVQKWNRRLMREIFALEKCFHIPPEWEEEAEETDAERSTGTETEPEPEDEPDPEEEPERSPETDAGQEEGEEAT